MPLRAPSESVLAGAVLALLLAALAATCVVVASHAPPLFNESIRLYHRLNLALLGGLTLVCALLAASFRVARLAWARRAIVAGFAFLATLEALLCVFDTCVVSVAGSPVASAFRNLYTRDGVLFLAQPNQQSPFGFREARTEERTEPGYRILFLGNSYVSGSGTTLDANYPQVAEAELRRLLPQQHISVFSAGVAGFGPMEDRILYEYLLNQGYHFDAIVMNFMLGSDPTNDIPNTFRRAMAGEPQRLPDGLFQRWFHPMNTYLFRYAIYLRVTMGREFGAPGADAVTDASCAGSEAFREFSRERAYLYYGPGANQRLFLQYAQEQMQALGKIARANGTRVFTVLLPDPNALLPANRTYFADQGLDWDWIRHTMGDGAPADGPVLDLSDDFLGRTDQFVCNDTHWNDPGNIAGGKRVAQFLAQSLASNNPARVATH